MSSRISSMFRSMACCSGFRPDARIDPVSASPVFTIRLLLRCFVRASFETIVYIQRKIVPISELIEMRERQ